MRLWPSTLQHAAQACTPLSCSAGVQARAMVLVQNLCRCVPPRMLPHPGPGGVLGMLTLAAQRSMSSAAGLSTAQQGSGPPAASSPAVPGLSREAEAEAGASAGACRAPGLLPTAVQALANAASHGALQHAKLPWDPRARAA